MGPLAGYRIIEMAGIGPAPFAAMLLADMGAEVIRVDRREAADLGLPGREPKFEVLHRGRRSLVARREVRRPGAASSCGSPPRPTPSSKASGRASWSGWGSAPTRWPRSTPSSCSAA